MRISPSEVADMTEKNSLNLDSIALLKAQLEKVNWNLDYGSVKVQIRQGKPTLITIERTVRMD